MYDTSTILSIIVLLLIFASDIAEYLKAKSRKK